MKKYATSIAAFIAIIFVGNALVRSGSSLNGEFDKSVLERQVIDTQKTLPRKQGEFSTVTGVAFENDILSYDVEFEGFEVKEDELDKFQSAQFVANVFSVCLNALLPKALNAGVSLQYRYTISELDKGFTNTVSEVDCLPFSENDATSLADYYVELQNKTLPRAIDTETNVTRYSRDGKAISIAYQIHRFTIAELDVNAVAAVVQENYRIYFCDAPDFRVMSEKGFSFNLIYSDMNNEEIYEFKLDKSKCA